MKEDVSEDIPEIINENATKSINIVGVSNRYQIKKLTNKDDINKKKMRKEPQKWQLPEEVYDRKYQLNVLHSINDDYTNDNEITDCP